ncbi:hypothetical protein Emin_0538 [Elusimicrobium minutum Pei191]|uniref:Uncharacterized protein n=1 Tax=Elusimicrobium minutum (strain Pei191) TaxID=445932 RepID=B2KCH2_ELUMP|nr:hypothetical protein [Elusimicrobium minutum]ACC98093.1 hypothetical protein Emin_0538 [Elusimicrobium minutum Pei191]
MAELQVKNGAGNSNTPNKLFNVVPVFASHLASVILPYTIGAAGIFFITFYIVSNSGGVNAIPHFFIFAFLFLFFGPFLFIYSLLIAGVHTLKTLAGVIEDFVNEFADEVKSSAEKRVNSMEEGLPKTQAKIILNASIKEVSAAYKENRKSSLAKAFAVFILSFVVYAARIVLFGKVKNASGVEISLSTVFGGKAALAGVIFFNLKLIMTILLTLGYILGLILLAAQIAFMVWL